jgi:hypothetical protein
MTTAINVARKTQRIPWTTLKVARNSIPTRVTKTVIVYARTMPATVFKTSRMQKMR